MDIIIMVGSKSRVKFREAELVLLFASNAKIKVFGNCYSNGVAPKSKEV